MRHVLCLAAVATSASAYGPVLSHQRMAAGRALNVHMIATEPVLTDDEIPEGVVSIPGSLPEGVVCARGVCVVDELTPEVCTLDEASDTITCTPNPNAAEGRPRWPSALLLGCSVLYGTNFPLGRLMNDALPASATSSARFAMAALALSPFLPQLNPKLRAQAMLCGSFTALGYASQSIALVDTPAATVAFLGALTVIICPALSAVVDRKQLGFDDAPQTWLAAVLALAGVALLELAGSDGVGAIGWGDGWSVLQAVGFGTSFFLTEKMMTKDPSQALPITAAQCAVAALVSAIWALADGLALPPLMDGPTAGWLLDESSRASATLPGLLLDPSMRVVAAAAAWTGLITTAANRLGETTALGKVSSAEASVLLATEPIWAALFAALLLGESLGWNDGAGGALLVGACLVNSAEPEQVRQWLRISPQPAASPSTREALVDDVLTP